MDNPALNQRFKVLGAALGGLILAIFLGNEIGSANYAELILGAVIVAGVLVAFCTGRFFWVLTIASSFLGGTFPILGGSFTPFQFLMGMGVAKFLIEDVVLKRTKINFGNRFDRLLIAGFMGILTWHGIHDRFGMKFLGSNVWGGRNYVNVYVGLAAFFVIQSLPIKSKIWSKLPYVILAVISFDLLIAIITTIFPNSIYKIYPFYSAISVAGLEEVIGGGDELTGRVGSFGNFGFALVAFVLASVTIKQLFSPSNLLRLISFIGGSISILYSGFRSTVVETLVLILAAGVRDLKWAVLALLPLLAIFLFGLSVINSQFVALPKQIQRSLTFLPGNWDTIMAQDADSSNDFRRQVWTLWAKDYFPRQPLLGRGFGFQSQWTQTSRYNPRGIDFRQTVEVGNIHNGLFATLDSLGLIGTFFFIIWNIRLLVRSLRVPFNKNDPEGKVLRFLALYLTVRIISYLYGAQNVGTFLPQEFALAGVFLRLLEFRKIEQHHPLSPAPREDRSLETKLLPA